VTIKSVGEWQSTRSWPSATGRPRVPRRGRCPPDPPANGLGSNTSVQDAYNLAGSWAWCCPAGGDHLLDSYHDERQPVGSRSSIAP